MIIIVLSKIIFSVWLYFFIATELHLLHQYEKEELLLWEKAFKTLELVLQTSMNTSFLRISQVKFEKI